MSSNKKSLIIDKSLSPGKEGLNETKCSEVKEKLVVCFVLCAASLMFVCAVLTIKPKGLVKLVWIISDYHKAMNANGIILHHTGFLKSTFEAYRGCRHLSSSSHPGD